MKAKVIAEKSAEIRPKAYLHYVAVSFNWVLGCSFFLHQRFHEEILHEKYVPLELECACAVQGQSNSKFI